MILPPPTKLFTLCEMTDYFLMKLACSDVDLSGFLIVFELNAMSQISVTNTPKLIIVSLNVTHDLLIIFSKIEHGSENYGIPNLNVDEFKMKSVNQHSENKIGW